MTSTSKDPVLVVLQLTGGNDYLNTVVPYGDPLYYDNRSTVNVSPERVLPMDDKVGLQSCPGPRQGTVRPGRCGSGPRGGVRQSQPFHFRSMDIWHTCEPDKIGTEGWLGKVIRDMDPRGENVLTGVNFDGACPGPWPCPMCPWRRWRCWRTTVC